MRTSSTSERLKQILSERNLRQIDLLKLTEPYCKEYGVKMNKSDISQYCSGKATPQQEKLYILGAVLNVNEAWLMGFDVPMSRYTDADRFARTAEAFNEAHPHLSAVRIPVVRRVAAGIPLDSIEEIIGWEEMPAYKVKNDTYFGLKIQGNSMEPGIADGDIVLCREQSDAEDGQIVVALINGNDGVCKRLKKYDNGMIALMSDNPAYPPIYFNSAEVDGIPVVIRGVVKELRRTF